MIGSSGSRMSSTRRASQSGRTRRKWPSSSSAMVRCSLGGRCDAEISLAHALVAEKRGTGAVHDDAAVLQHVGLIGELERERHVLLDEKACDPLVVELVDGVEHHARDVWR